MKIAGKTKIDKIRKSCGIQPIKEWMEKRRREWDEHVTRMDVKRLIEISRDDIIQDVRKEDGST